MDHETRRTFIAGVGALAVFPRLAAAAQPREGHARHAIPPMPQRVDGDGPGFKPLFDGRTLSGCVGIPNTGVWRMAP